MRATAPLAIITLVLSLGASSTARAESYYPRDFGPDIAAFCSCNDACTIYGSSYRCVDYRCVVSSQSGRVCDGGGPPPDRRYPETGPWPSPYWEGLNYGPETGVEAGGNFEDGGYWPPSDAGGPGKGDNGSNLSDRTGCAVAGASSPGLAVVLCLLFGLWLVGRERGHSAR